MARPEITGRKFISKKSVADRYDDVVRTVDRWTKAGVLPPPDITVHKRGYWDEAGLDRHDRRRTVERAAQSVKSADQSAA